MTTDSEFIYALRLADDALVLGHRLSEWSGKAPSLEEDIGLSNLGLDLIGQARLFYQLAARLEAKGRDEDQFAFFRDAADFRNVLLVELPGGDFAFTMARQLIVAAYLHPLYDTMTRSASPGLAEIAAKAVKEMAYHVRHSAEWVIRLGDGTAESHHRMVAALKTIWPFAHELFEADAVLQTLVTSGIAPDPTLVKLAWTTTIDKVLRQATLHPPLTAGRRTGGRAGRHTEHLTDMLAEMQSLARAHPGATW